jgi:hypothetical protein
MTKFDPALPLADKRKELRQSHCQVRALAFAVLDAVHEKSAELQRIEAVVLHSINILDFVQQTAVHEREEFLYREGSSGLDS